MTIRERTLDLLKKAEAGQSLEAIEMHYHPDVTIIEADGQVFQGKEKQKERMVEFMGTIEAMHGGGVAAVTVDEENRVSMVESSLDATFKGMGRAKIEEVEVYRWDADGLVTEARFYYNRPGA
ncbi:MAG: SnoaL-like domain-containing protein [Bacteroidota bacterium]